MIEELLIPLVEPRFLADEKYRNWYIGVINPLPGRMILGVHVPKMKQLAKNICLTVDSTQILKEYELAIQNENIISYEEMLVWGLIINYLKIPANQKYNLIRRYLPLLDNWAVCDMFCSNIKWVKDKYEFWKFLEPYWESCREFEVRFAIVSSIGLYLDDEWFPMICERVERLNFCNIKSDYHMMGTLSPYYVRMGVAWLLSAALAKVPEMVRDYVNGCGLPEDVLKLYIRKARESHRTRNISPI